MNPTRPDPGARALRAARLLATTAALALFCWVLAHWVWRVLEPAATLPPRPVLSDWSAAILAGPALGFARGGTAPLAGGPAPAAAAPADGRIRLMGIARESTAAGRQGPETRALFKVDQKRVLWLRAGETLETGIVLAAIEADGVRLEQAGREIRLPLREPRPVATPAAAAGRGAAFSARAARAAASPSAAASAVTATATADNCKLAPEQRQRAYVLRPELIESVLRERSGFADVFKATPDGLLVQNPGGTGALLGLYASDLLREAGGARLAGVDDLARLVLQPLARNESVVVAGTRSGQPREWVYTGMNCPPR